MSDDGMFSKLLDTDKPKTKPVQENTVVSTVPKVEAVKNQPKKQISAYLSIPQHTIFKKLYHKLNSTEANVDKSEIVGLSLEILSAVIGDETPNYSTLFKLKEYLEEKVSKYK